MAVNSVHTNLNELPPLRPAERIWLCEMKIACRAMAEIERLDVGQEIVNFVRVEY